MSFKVGDKVWFFRTDRQNVTGHFHAIHLNDTYLDFSTIVKMHDDGHILLQGWGEDEFWSFHLYKNKNDALRALELRCYEIVKREQRLIPLTDTYCDHSWQEGRHLFNDVFCTKCNEVKK